MAAGDLTLAGRRVFGKVIEAGPHTSIVRRASEPGYRDVVRLGHVVDGVVQLGPRGVLEGTGEHQARLRLVAASEDVAPGWLVLTAGHEGLSPHPLVYGVVSRAERKAACRIGRSRSNWLPTRMIPRNWTCCARR